MQLFAVWNAMYNSQINTDVLILGNSRAKLVISPEILDSTLHINSYNLGINGGFFPIQNAMFKAYVQHNKLPKYIIQSIDFTTFSNGPHLSNSDQFIPYIDDTLVRNIASIYEEKFTIPEIYLPLFKYNNHATQIKEGIFCYFNFGHRGTNSMYKGFSPTNTPFDNFFEERMKTDPDYLMNTIDKKVEAEFVSYLDYCKANNIKLIFVYCPVLQPVTRCLQPDTSAITRRIIEYVKQYNIPYISYLDDSICYHKELFADHIHLNVKGSQLFNKKLAADISNLIHN